MLRCSGEGQEHRLGKRQGYGQNIKSISALEGASLTTSGRSTVAAFTRLHLLQGFPLVVLAVSGAGAAENEIGM